MEHTSRPAVFLDRDGTLNVDVDFLDDPAELVLIDGAAEAVLALNEAGFVVAVVTNQSGIARGYLDEARLAEIHGRLEAELGAAGAHLDGIFYCPHHPTEGAPPYRRPCECRKPAPGLLRAATEELDLDLSRSFVIGDSPRDIEAGAALGVPGYLVGDSARQLPPGATAIRVADLATAVEHLLREVRQGK